MTPIYDELYETLFADQTSVLRVSAVQILGNAIFVDEGGTMTLQDQLRSEEGEVADTGSLLTQAADRIDALEAELAAAGGTSARVAELEAALDQLTAIIAAVR